MSAGEYDDDSFYSSAEDGKSNGKKIVVAHADGKLRAGEETKEVDALQSARSHIRSVTEYIEYMS